jgi:hypothetical protein
MITRIIAWIAGFIAVMLLFACLCINAGEDIDDEAGYTDGHE